MQICNVQHTFSSISIGHLPSTATLATYYQPHSQTFSTFYRPAALAVGGGVHSPLICLFLCLLSFLLGCKLCLLIPITPQHTVQARHALAITITKTSTHEEAKLQAVACLTQIYVLNMFATIYFSSHIYTRSKLTLILKLFLHTFFLPIFEKALNFLF